MWEHGRCLESVLQDAISRCGHLDSHNIGICEMWARPESIGTLQMNATGRCAAKHRHFCRGAECMCEHNGT
jgi:hypothetical protein